MTVFIPYVQAAVGVGLVVYAVYLVAQKVRGRLPRRRDPVVDMRLVVDLAARLRADGKTEAVAVCQQLLDELLKPAELPKP